MIEITNLKRFPVQVLVRSKTKPRSFTSLNIPGVGSGNNIRYIKDEDHTNYIDLIENDHKLIRTRYINDKDIQEVE